jgi:hypothetical protein
MAKNAFTKKAGATPGHRRKFAGWGWLGHVPKLYQSGFVKVAYESLPRRIDTDAHEGEVAYMWGLQGAINYFAAMKGVDMHMIAATGQAAATGIGAMRRGHDRPEEPYGNRE